MRLKIWNDTEGHTRGMTGDNKIVTIDTEHQKRDEENNNTDLGKIENKYSGTEGG
jgi:hypothetical protein